MGDIDYSESAQYGDIEKRKANLDGDIEDIE
jgi:hypothetical protein